MVEKFLVQKSKDNQFYFQLIAPNGETIATSETYSTKDNAMNGIEAVKTYAATAEIEDNTKEE